jgi:SDR family mycofactocin-dependent oxidoreductase
MSGRVEGKVALVTGAARGQGRAHALRLAEEGADIIALDVCQDLPDVPYALGTPDDLTETKKLVEGVGRRCVEVIGDVRNFSSMKQLVDEGVRELGRLDIACANAGVTNYSASYEMTEDAWDAVVDINLKGVWHTTKVAVPHMISQAQGGSIIMTGSVAAYHGARNSCHYGATKHGLLGLMRSLSVELGQHSIRVNSVHPTTVRTPMAYNQLTYDLFAPELESPGVEVFEERMLQLHSLPVPAIDAVDMSNAVLFLASDEARYITGEDIKVDCGATAK